MAKEAKCLYRVLNGHCVLHGRNDVESSLRRLKTTGSFLLRNARRVFTAGRKSVTTWAFLVGHYANIGSRGVAKASRSGKELRGEAGADNQAIACLELEPIAKKLGFWHFDPLVADKMAAQMDAFGDFGVTEREARTSCLINPLPNLTTQPYGSPCGARFM
jgi:hypothetical protein